MNRQTEYNQKHKNKSSLLVKTMQTHFSEQLSLDAISTQAVANLSLLPEQLETPALGPWDNLLENVDELLRIE